MRQKKYVCLLLCLILALTPIISLAEGEQGKTNKPVESTTEQSTENSNEAVQETPVVEET